MIEKKTEVVEWRKEKKTGLWFLTSDCRIEEKCKRNESHSKKCKGKKTRKKSKWKTHQSKTMKIESKGKQSKKISSFRNVHFNWIPLILNKQRIEN